MRLVQKSLTRRTSSSFTRSLSSFVTPAPIAAPLSFPRFFSPHVAPDGLLLQSFESRPPHEIVTSFPMAAHLQTSARQRPYFSALASSFSDAVKDGNALRLLNLLPDDVAEVRDYAHKLVESYAPFS